MKKLLIALFISLLPAIVLANSMNTDQVKQNQKDTGYIHVACGADSNSNSNSGNG